MRALAISLVGRLAALNPSYVLPCFRGHLMQLLADLERSPDFRQREGARNKHGMLLENNTKCIFQPGPAAESAWLLGRLVASSPRLVLPYVPPIFRTLVAKLRANVTLMLPLPAAPQTVKGPPPPGDLLIQRMACTLELLQ